MKKILFVLVLLSTVALAQTTAPDSTLKKYFADKESAILQQARALDTKIAKAKSELYDLQTEQALIIREFNALQTEKKKYIEDKKK